MPRGWRKFHVLSALSALLGIGAIALFLFLPTIAHWQIKSVLTKAGYQDATFTVKSASLFAVEIADLRAGKTGALNVSSARIDYSPVRALTGKIDAIRLEHAGITIDLDATQSSEAQRHFDLWSDANAHGLPIWRIELSDCALTFVRGQEMNQQKYIIHADGWLWREALDDRARISLTLHSDKQQTPGWLEGHVQFAAHQFDVSAGANDIDLARALPFAPSTIESVIDKAGGFVSALATIVYANGQAKTQASFTLRDGSVVTTNTPPIQIDGANAKVAFASLNPLRTDAGQILDVKALKIGENAFDNIHVEFDVDRRGLHPTTSSSQPFALPSHVRLSSLQFDWAGGTIKSASPIYVHPIDESISMKLDISHVGLNEFLKLVSSGKVSGSGKLSGNLAMKIAWPHVEIGAGSISTDAPGELNFGQQIGELATTMAQKDSRLAGQQQQIMAALASFHYDRIAFEFARTASGLQVVTQISGRGTKGLTTPIDLTVRYAGLEEALNAYLATSMRVNSDGER